MKKLRITESQLKAIQERENDLGKKKVLKINEDQYNRLFSKDKINESEDKVDKEIKPLEFAQELIVFIKDIVKNPKNVPFSSYWADLDISRKELFQLVKKHDLLTMMVDEATGANSYKAKKIGFRKGVKEVFKECNDKTLTEVGGYPMGAEDDPRAPYNQNDDSDSFSTTKGREIKNPQLKAIYHNEKSDDLMLLKSGDKLYAFIAANNSAEDFEEFMDLDNIIDAEAIEKYVNSLEQSKQLRITDKVDLIGEPNTLLVVTPEISQKLMSFYGNDVEMVNVLNQIPETTTAASSGSFVGGMQNAPIKRAIGTAPEEAMQDLNENGINPSHKYFAIFKKTGKIVDGWGDGGLFDMGELERYLKQALKNNFPNNEVTDFRLVSKSTLENEGVDPLEANNWGKVEMGETTSIGTRPEEATQDLNEVGGIDRTYTHFAVFRNNNKVADGWEFDGLENDEVKYYMKNDLKDNFPDNKIGDFRLVTKRKLEKEFDPFDSNNWYKIGMDETTSMGGPSGLQDGGNSMTFDAPAGDGSKFWNAGNKMNKKMSEGVNPGQIYKNGVGRIRVDTILGPDNIRITKWGSGSSESLNINPNQLSGWELFMEGKKKTIKLTEDQARMVAEYDGKNEGRYVAEMDFYVYAKDDKTAKYNADLIARHLDFETDNGAKITNLVRQQQGTLGSTPVGEGVKKKR